MAKRVFGAVARMAEQKQKGPRAGVARHTRWFLAGFYALAVVWGLRQTYDTRPSALDVLDPIASAICLGWWAVVDAERRGHRIPMLSRSWLFIFAEIAVPGYVIWSRGWRGAAWVAIHGLASSILFAITMFVAGMIGFGGKLPPQ